MRLLISVIVCLLFPLCISAQDWQEIKQFNPAQSLHSIKFLNDSLGWTVSSLYNGSTYNIHKTSDGGETWEDQSSGFTATRFKDIWIHDAQKVTMVGNWGYIIQTEDGGENWTVIDSSLENHLSGIFFINADVGFICGDAGSILKTEDGGENWIKLNSGVNSVLNDIHFIDEANGFACGWGVMIRTEDGGENWVSIDEFPIPTSSYQMQKIDFPSPEIGFVCGDIGQILKTEDGGLTWDFFISGTEESLQSLDFVSDQIGYACGFAGTIIKTVDGGNTWAFMSSDSDEIMFGIDFPSANLGFMSSWGGKVLKHEIMVSSLHALPKLGNFFSLYPNPINDQFQVVLDPLEWEQCIELRLLDITGQVLWRSSIQLDDSGVIFSSFRNVPLTSSNYFIQITDGRQSATKKISIINN